MSQEIQVGQRIRFDPNGGNRWWTVEARDERYIVVSQSAPFTGEPTYSVVDLRWSTTYNGVGPGIARSSMNLLGGGWNMDEPGWAQDILDNLNSDSGSEMSLRRICQVKSIEVEKPRRRPR